MKVAAIKSAPRARRVPAHDWVRDVVGELPQALRASPALEARMTSYASHVVASACLKVRRQEGADACQLIVEGLILSAAHIAAGIAGESPSKVLRSLSEALEDPLDPSVRERANA